jgi:transcriptional regulator with XRE-family HTH domain
VVDIVMKTQEYIDKIIRKGKIDNELDFERAQIIERKLRVLSKENPDLKPLRQKLRDIIGEYKNNNWHDISTIDEKKIKESDNAEFIAEKERGFIDKRKHLIKEKLKELNLTQQELGVILGHRSKTHISELMNGVCPFSLKDLIIINRILKINMEELIPNFLSKEEQERIKSAIKRLNKPQIKLKKGDLMPKYYY